MTRARRNPDQEPEYIPTLEEEAEIEAGLAELERGESVTLTELISIWHSSRHAPRL